MMRWVIAWAGLAIPMGTLVRAQVAPSDTTLSLRAAVLATLASAPVIALARRTAQGQRGALELADAPFVAQPQLTISGNTSRSIATTSTVTPDGAASYAYSGLRSTDVQYALSAPQAFRFGVTVTPSVSVDRATESDLPLPAPNRSTVGLSVLVPLLRGRGGGRTTGVDRAAAAQVDASELDVRHAMAQAALGTITGYWSYRAAVEKLDALRESEARADQLVHETERLIEADERPAADRHQLDANLSSKIAQRIAGEEAVSQAREALGLAMGASADSIARLALPDTPLPSALPLDTGQTPRGRRDDLAAAEVRRQGAHALADDSRHDDRPQLDFTATIGYAGFFPGNGVARLFDPIYRNIGGPSTTFQLSFNPHVGASVERGLVAQDLAAEASARITAADLRRTIDANVATDRTSVRHAIDRVARTRQAAALFVTVLDNEKQRFRLGSSTLFDVIKAEDDLTQARLDDIDAHAAYAEALAQLAFDAGVLFVHGDRTDSVAIDRVAPAAR